MSLPTERDQITISFASAETMVRTLGPQDLLLRILDGLYPELTVSVRGEDLEVQGPDRDVSQARQVIEDLHGLVRRGTNVTPEVIEQVTSLVRGGSQAGASGLLSASILSSRGRKIRPKTLNQQHYVESIDANTITLGLGPAGTGKTYLAMAKAVQALQAQEINRIILTRPAVEAGERLGYLPGSLSEKIDPYLRPLYDALHDMVEPESIPRLMADGTIEVAPLAYMRGRTLNDAFIILDEAQNTTGEQMKMFLTRLGFGSHMVVTGDTSQVDLPRGVTSGLAQAVSVLEGLDDIAIIRLRSVDVVRHRLVSRIVDAYEEESHGR
ncbi:PhoH family protein [Citricoccus sp. I39-566]|uniref:PhoH family protein n=1 Tax=Citricoccus sp. I39-566 TaxID=3073268 RepID=UPI00286CF68C|nr:PhoH family protein [Citricoccus sp. I39-566]WMY77471.1 PhoH family protein [Citricoccus sp. I39-566]